MEEAIYVSLRQRKNPFVGVENQGGGGAGR